MDLDLQIKTYNNKSRKGKYVYIKEPGKRARVLKYHKNLPLSVYEYAYTHKTSWTELNNANKILKPTYAKKHQLADKLNKGITEYRTTLGRLANPQERKKAYMALIQPLAKKMSPGMKNLVIHNMEKQQRKFMYRLEGMVSDGTTTGLGLEITDIGGKNIEDVVNIYHNKIRLQHGKMITNQGDMEQEIADIARIPDTNVTIHETNKRLILVKVIIRFTH